LHLFPIFLNSFRTSSPPKKQTKNFKIKPWTTWCQNSTKKSPKFLEKLNMLSS
jgi:hypothetical protein